MSVVLNTKSKNGSVKKNHFESLNAINNFKLTLKVKNSYCLIINQNIKNNVSY